MPHVPDPVVENETEIPALAASPEAEVDLHARVMAWSHRAPVCPHCMSTNTRWASWRGVEASDLLPPSAPGGAWTRAESSAPAGENEPPRSATKSTHALFCDACLSATPTYSERPLWTRDDTAGDDYDRPTPRRPQPLPDGRPGWPGGLLTIWGRSTGYYIQNRKEVRVDEILGREDEELDGLVILNRDRVEELDRCLRVEGPAALGKDPGRTEVVIVGLLCVWLWNAARSREGLPDAIINPEKLKPTSLIKICGALASDEEGDGATVSFETPFACAAAAIGSAFASAESPSLLGFGGLFTGDGNTSTPIPQGLRWNEVTCHPFRGGALRTRGEDRLLSDLGARTSISRARVGRTVDGTTGKVIHPGREISEAELELLQLVEYGVDRGAAAKRTKAGTITPAVEAMKVEAALPLLRAPGHPTTKKEAQQMLTRARRAISEALQDTGMIPIPRLKPNRSRAVADQPREHSAGRTHDLNPFAVPSAIDPMGCVS